MHSWFTTPVLTSTVIYALKILQPDAVLRHEQSQRKHPTCPPTHTHFLGQRSNFPHPSSFLFLSRSGKVSGDAAQAPATGVTTAGTAANAQLPRLRGRNLLGACAKSRKLIHCHNLIFCCLSSFWPSPLLRQCTFPTAHLRLKPLQKAVQQHQHPSALSLSRHLLASH